MRKRMTSLQSSCRTGFTLVEVLVVIAIIGVLLALLLPAVQYLRESTRRTNCINQLRQLGLAYQNHHDAFQAFPSLATYTLTGPTNNAKLAFHSQKWALLPYLEADQLYQEYNVEVPFADASNATVTNTRLNVFVCPSNPAGFKETTTTFKPSDHLGNNLASLDARFTATFVSIATDYEPVERILGAYAGQFGYDANQDLYGVFRMPALPTSYEIAQFQSGRQVGPKQEAIRISGITDGLTKTILLTEVAGRPDLWSGSSLQQPGEVIPGAGWLDPTHPVVIGKNNPAALINGTNNNEIFSFHAGGVHVLMGDGSVQFLAENIDPTLVIQQLTPDADDNSI